MSGSSFGIDGLDDAQVLALLNELKQHATAPRYCHRVDCEPGDVVVWGNAQLLHKALLPSAGEARTLWRITIKES